MQGSPLRTLHSTRQMAPSSSSFSPNSASNPRGTIATTTGGRYKSRYARKRDEDDGGEGNQGVAYRDARTRRAGDIGEQEEREEEERGLLAGVRDEELAEERDLEVGQVNIGTELRSVSLMATLSPWGMKA